MPTENKKHQIDNAVIDDNRECWTMYSMVHHDIYGFHELVNKTHTEVVGSETSGNEKLNPFDQRKTASE